jgi:hypothetical protein
MTALLREIDPTPQASSDGHTVTYEIDLPEPAEEESSSGPLFDLLRAAGRGLEVLLKSLEHPRSSGGTLRRGEAEAKGAENSDAKRAGRPTPPPHGKAATRPARP